ncbi:hypothetical protein GCM10007147_45980 [Nocardiopsis kunsanensis]|uniref:FtsK domain-containing protein n=1 Tax=Nocardiopsis kunsanensis TaxID=141693 RepID=A0A918XMH7_9ACTN|nr:FtsK/SpoIIIE domain-containing protein [Nocardiopsis kunsanensis]GHD37784.1 hypothetical protein GCM10007147_45980 [Nocardiopsis kunsanensis]
MLALVTILAVLLVALLALRAAPPIIWTRYRHKTTWYRAAYLVYLAWRARRVWFAFCRDKKLAKLVKEGRTTTRQALFEVMPGVRVERRECDQWKVPKLKISAFGYGLQGRIKITTEASYEALDKVKGELVDLWQVRRIEFDHSKSGVLRFNAYVYEPLEEDHSSPLLDADPVLQLGTLTSATPIPLLVDQVGKPITLSLRSSAHGLLAGGTRSGKSITANSLLAYASLMSDVRVTVIDPNLAAAAPWYRTAHAVCTSADPNDAIEYLREIRREMESRQQLFWDGRTDRLTDFTSETPLWLLVIDEVTNYTRHPDKKAREAFTAELLAVASQAAKFGIRLWLLAQKPDSSVLPTAIRTNLSTRICHRVDTIEDFAHLFQDARSLEITAADRSMPQGVAVVHLTGMQAPARAKGYYLPTEACWRISDALVAAGHAVRELPGLPDAEVVDFPTAEDHAV